MPNYPAIYRNRNQFQEKKIFKAFLERNPDYLQDLYSPKVNPEIVKQMETLTKNVECAKSIAASVEEFFKTQELQKLDAKVVEKKVEKLAEDVLMKKIKFESKSQKQIQKQNILKQIKKQQMRKQIQNTENQIMKKISNIQKDFKITNQNSQSKAILQEKKKQLVEKKAEIKNKNKVQFKKSEKENSILFSSQSIDMKRIQTAIKKKLGENSIFQVSFNSHKTLRGGNGPAYQIKLDLDMAKIQTELSKLIKQMETIASSSNLASASVYQQALRSYKQNIDKLNKQFLEKKTELDQLNKQGKIKNIFNEIDVCIVMDTTGSMSSYLQQAKKDSKSIIQNFKKQYPQSSIKYSFVSYKDHCDSKVVQSFDFNQATQIEKNIFNVSATGGGDAPQAVHDGLFQVRKLNWRISSTKFVFLILDAPPHGLQYTQGNDDHKNGCPCGIKLSQITSFYESKQIHINLKKCGSGTGKTQQVFKNAFSSKLFGVSSLDAKDFSNSIVQDIKNKIKQLQKKVQQAAKQFAQMTNSLLEQVKKDIQLLVVEVQSFKQIQEVKKEIDELNSFFTSVNELKQKQKNLKSADQKQEVKDISKKFAQIMNIAKKAQELKKMASQLRDKIEKEDVDAIFNLLKADILQRLQYEKEYDLPRAKWTRKFTEKHRMSNDLFKKVLAKVQINPGEPVAL